ncbi:MAG: hypothetical protein KAV80_02390, partial [Methanomicrobia archaeon]|nr:hypothetical protein [Methanomicrobia archaeon]
MKKDNKILVVLIFIFFLFSSYAYREYEDWKGEKYVPNRFKSTVYESPTRSPNGLFFLDGFLW